MDDKDRVYEKALRDIGEAEKAAALPYDWFVTKEHATRADEIIKKNAQERNSIEGRR